MITDILWPLAVVLIWGLLFLITVLLVRMTTHGQQREARMEREAELAVAQVAQSGAEPPAASRARPATPTPQPLGPPISAA